MGDKLDLENLEDASGSDGDEPSPLLKDAWLSLMGRSGADAGVPGAPREPQSVFDAELSAARTAGLFEADPQEGTGSDAGAGGSGQPASDLKPVDQAAGARGKLDEAAEKELEERTLRLLEQEEREAEAREQERERALRAERSIGTRLGDLTRQELEGIRMEVDGARRDPAAALLEAMSRKRILAMGEAHGSPSPQRELGAALMPRLKEAGATHLALELPTSEQEKLDRFMETGNPDDLPRDALYDWQRGGKRRDDYVAMLRSAREGGLKLVAIDTKGRTAFDSEGDRAMAERIGQILESDPANKVLFWVGNQHLHQDDGQGRLKDYKSAAEFLRESKWKDEMITVLEERQEDHDSALARVAGDRREAIAIPTDRAAQLGELNRSASGEALLTSRYKYWDLIILHPGRER